jgi:hypothetical protein
MGWSHIVKGSVFMAEVGDFIRMSAELNLFFLRIMKEHAFFLQMGFTDKEKVLSREAGIHSKNFEELLNLATELANGNVGKDAKNSGEFVTHYTLDAERATQYFTGFPFDYDTTRAEMNLQSGIPTGDVQRWMSSMYDLDQKALVATNSLINFKQRIYQDVTACRIFTTAYPHLIDHIIREAQLYVHMLEMLLNSWDTTDYRRMVEQEVFWNQIMRDHSKFIAGMLDPTEDRLIDTAREFSETFDRLSTAAQQANRTTFQRVTDQSLEATLALQNFKANGARGILGCNIRSVILPLLSDHVLREANHYIRILRQA